MGLLNANELAIASAGFCSNSSSLEPSPTVTVGVVGSLLRSVVVVIARSVVVMGLAVVVRPWAGGP